MGDPDPAQAESETSVNKPHASSTTTTHDTEAARDIGDEYETPAPEPFSSFTTLKDRIRQHYELASDYYYSLW